MISVEVGKKFATPHSTGSLDVELWVHREKVVNVAYVLYETRNLMARTDPYTSQIIVAKPPEELARRDWILAESLVSQNPESVPLVYQRYDRLRAKG